MPQALERSAAFKKPLPVATEASALSVASKPLLTGYADLFGSRIADGIPTQKLDKMKKLGFGYPEGQPFSPAVQAKLKVGLTKENTTLKSAQQPPRDEAVPADQIPDRYMDKIFGRVADETPVDVFAADGNIIDAARSGQSNPKGRASRWAIAAGTTAAAFGLAACGGVGALQAVKTMHCSAAKGNWAGGNNSATCPGLETYPPDGNVTVEYGTHSDGLPYATITHDGKTKVVPLNHKTDISTTVPKSHGQLIVSITGLHYNRDVLSGVVTEKYNPPQSELNPPVVNNTPDGSQSSKPSSSQSGQGTSGYYNGEVLPKPPGHLHCKPPTWSGDVYCQIGKTPWTYDKTNHTVSQ